MPKALKTCGLKPCIILITKLNRLKFLIAVYNYTLKIVTEFWKITLMGMPETSRLFEFTTILMTSQNIRLSISTLVLVIQSIFNVLEPYINKKYNFQATFQN